MGKQPNIIFILSDDQGAWSMNCAGTPELYTPNLDKIAARGMRFENFFCVSPVCSPARASLLTGNIPSAHGVHDWIRSGDLDGEKFAAQGKENPYGGGYQDEIKPIAYLEGQTTYTDLLVQNGYTCALSGKWHLGDSVLPQHGFTRWYSLGKGGCFYYDPDIVENGDIVVEHGKYVTELITNKALTYLDEMQKEEKPFYLAVNYTAPHTPWELDQHPKKWVDYYKDCAFESFPDVPDHPNMTTGPVYGTANRRRNLIGYGAALSAMDEQIGRILDKLEQDNLTENTLVIFAGDNGMSMGHHGIWGKGNGTFPFNMYDTAVKVPFLASLPGVIPEGMVNDDLVSAYDVFPTILELTGIANEREQELPGRSFLDLLRGEQKSAEEQTVVVYDEYGPVRMIRTKEWKYVHRYPYGPHELYDLVNDPNEEKNLFAEKAYAEKIVEMRGHLEDWFALYVNPDRDGAKEGVTGGGQMCLAGRRANRPDVYGPL